MAETAVENGVVDADRTDDCDADFNAAKEAVQSLQELSLIHISEPTRPY